MNNALKQILLVNDDGINSPGLWAAAEALSELGYVTVAAPRDQASSTGRSLPITSDGRIHKVKLQVGAQEWEAYSVGGTPAQTTLHGVLELTPRKPDLVVAGINYGENVGDGVTISGTVGAAMEAASMGIPALAMSLQLVNHDFYGYSREVDFSTAAYFTRYFAKMLLENRMPQDVGVLKVEVPATATPKTAWRLTRQAVYRYFESRPTRTGSLEDSAPIGYNLVLDWDKIAPDTDLYALLHDQVVAVTPLSLDLTSRVDFKAFELELKSR
ncbi:MAG TPA: 5'/3'-nucleotidase SurE, partial [Anaerolineaceae bacterium]|nr:5'/3'-nucleotidase SurE [Anaerolineaceae bacterium]